MNSRAAKHQHTISKQTAKGPLQSWWIAVAVVAIIGFAFVVAQSDDKAKPSNQSEPKYGREIAPADLVTAVAEIPDTTLSAVGQGTATMPRSTGEPATSEVIFVGAEFCPYCAAERWALVNALSRFGTFTNLSITTSSATDIYPNTPTFSFYGAKYTSEYITFSATEIATNEPKSDGGGYKPLEEPSESVTQLWRTHSPQGGVPFLSIGNQFVATGPSYDVAVLADKSYDAVASDIDSPGNPISDGAVGAANVITAAICATTDNQPAKVCANATIAELQRALK